MALCPRRPLIAWDLSSHKPLKQGMWGGWFTAAGTSSF